MENSMMLNARSDDVTAFRAQESCSTKNSQIDAFGSAARKDQFAGFAPEEVRSAIPGVVQMSPGFASDVMNT